MPRETPAAGRLPDRFELNGDCSERTPLRRYPTSHRGNTWVQEFSSAGTRRTRSPPESGEAPVSCLNRATECSRPPASTGLPADSSSPPPAHALSPCRNVFGAAHKTGPVRDHGGVLCTGCSPTVHELARCYLRTSELAARRATQSRKRRAKLAPTIASGCRRGARARVSAPASEASPSFAPIVGRRPQARSSG